MNLAIAMSGGPVALMLAFGQPITIAQKPNRAAVAPSSDRRTRTVVEAANSFLSSLSVQQRQKIQFAFTPQKFGTVASFHRTADGGGAPGGFIGERYGQVVWSNYPVSDVPRPGLRLGTLTTSQHAAAMRLLQSVLSPMGYQKVLDIMGSDQALTDAGTNFALGEAVYTIGIFGEPSAQKLWMLEFGGHHLALNIVIAGGDGTMTPTLTGAQPSVYTHGGKTIRVLAQENDTAFALLGALDDKQKKQAVLDYEVRDLVLGPGQAGKQIQPEGLKASAMNAQQRAMLLNVIAPWAGIMNDNYARPRMAEIQADLNETYFAWSGPLTHAAGKNGTSYYRIQGPRLVIEFSPQGVAAILRCTSIQSIAIQPTTTV